MMKYAYKITHDELGYQATVELEDGRVLHRTEHWASEMYALQMAQTWVEKEWPKYRKVLLNGSITDGYERLQVNLTERESHDD